MNSIIKEIEKKFNEKKEIEKEYFKNFKDLKRSSAKYFYEMLILQGDVRKLERENSDLKRREIEYLTKRIENLETSSESLKKQEKFSFWKLEFFTFLFNFTNSLNEFFYFFL